MAAAAIELALQELLQLQPLDEAPNKAGEVSRSDSTARRKVQELVRAAAAFLDALDGAQVAEPLRTRANLVRKETAPGTPYDESRKKFIGLFGDVEMEEMGSWPIPEDFGILGPTGLYQPAYVAFRSNLQHFQQVSTEYKTYVPHLRETQQYRPPAAPPFPPVASQSTAGTMSSDNSLTSAAMAENPYDVADAWLNQLHRLELLAEKENFWGSALIKLSHDVRDPAQGRRRKSERLYAALESCLNEALRAIQKAALDAVAMIHNTGCEHSPDFRWVLWYGQKYTFTPQQAACVRLLWNAWEKGWPGVTTEELIKESGSACLYAKDIFKSSPAWKKMIISPNRGIYCLKPTPLPSTR